VSRVRAGPTGRRFRLQGNIFSHTPKDYADVFKHHKVIASLQGLQDFQHEFCRRTNKTDRQAGWLAGGRLYSSGL